MLAAQRNKKKTQVSCWSYRNAHLVDCNNDNNNNRVSPIRPNARRRGVTPPSCELVELATTPPPSWSWYMMQPPKKRWTHSKKAFGTWKVSTSWASATTGACGLTSPSDIVFLPAYVAFGWGEFRRELGFGALEIRRRGAGSKGGAPRARVETGLRKGRYICP